MVERLGPMCPAGDACEGRIFLEEYERVDHEARQELLRKNAALRLEVNRLEKELSVERDPEEKRDDGKRVRKNRWESGIRRIVKILKGNSSDFEIDDIVLRVGELAEKPKERLENLGVAFAVKVWPCLPDDKRWSWLNASGGYVVSPLERAVWTSCAEAKAEARGWSFPFKLVRIRYRRVLKRSTEPSGIESEKKK